MEEMIFELRFEGGVKGVGSMGRTSKQGFLIKYMSAHQGRGTVVFRKMRLYVISIFKPASPVNTTFILKAWISCKYLAMKSAFRTGQRNVLW